MDNKGKDGRPTSWMITCIATGEVFEVFDLSAALKATGSPFLKVETAAEYLARINREANHQPTQRV